MKKNDQNLIPSSMLLACTINNVTSMFLLKMLADSGGTAAILHRRALPKGCTPLSLPELKVAQTVEWTFTAKNFVSLDNIVLTEFNKNKIIDQHVAYVFDRDCCYDIILR
jgi:hypothetical protein